jgi:hypothetical protein
LPESLKDIGFTEDYRLLDSDMWLDGGSFGYLFEDSAGTQFALSLDRSALYSSPHEEIRGTEMRHATYLHVGSVVMDPKVGLIVPPRSKCSSFLTEFIWNLMVQDYTPDFLEYFVNLDFEDSQNAIATVYKLDHPKRGESVAAATGSLLYVYRALMR